MATPHVAGAAPYVKSLHPTWSSSAIQSSLITTGNYFCLLLPQLPRTINKVVYFLCFFYFVAWRMEASKNPKAEFAYGAEHLNLINAANPGLEYETSIDDSVKMLCTIGFNNSKLRTIAGNNATCPTGEKLTPKKVNYPTMTSYVAQNKPFTVSFPRTVINFGFVNSTYKENIINSAQLNITVKPDILSSKSLSKKKNHLP